MRATKLTHAEVLATLPPIVAVCLGIDEEEVRPESNFWNDLGGDSIDGLDLSFRCERAFGVQKPLQPLQDFLKYPLDTDGMIADTTISDCCARFPVLRERLNCLGKQRFAPADLLELYTIDTIAHLVVAASKLADTD